MTPDKDTMKAMLLHDFRQVRLINGDPSKYHILKKIVTTKTRHVIPDGWRWK